MKATTENKKGLLGVKAPSKECQDQKCPFHGSINVKKETVTGKVIKKDLNRSATIEWFRPYYVRKYERYETRKSTLRVHNPACLNAEVGDEVIVARTRPLSKTKNHVIIKIVPKATAIPIPPKKQKTAESSKSLENESDKEPDN